MVYRIAEKIKRKWPRNTKRARDNYEEMIGLVTENPMELAAKAAKLWAAKLKAFIESKAWPEIMKAIPFEVWQRITTKYGPPHFVDGVEAKTFKVLAFADAWETVYLPELEKLMKEIPPVTDADRERRMTQNRKLLISLKGKWRPAAKAVVPS